MKRKDVVKTLKRRRDWLAKKIVDQEEYDGRTYDLAECSALNWVLERMEIRKTIEKERKENGKEE